MTEELVNIEIDGKPIKARKGEMIIRAADREGIYIPRFCYHEKLSVAANCRMCLIEAEKAPKPLPACATPVAEGMKVFTRSVKALAAQRAVMEFLLINHPLDCPVCDQGGECELQDLSMGYGRDIARFSEGKRVIKDENIGPLISTFMTRCIYCTRCVRFGQEIAGIQELGDTGRGEHSRIGTYIGRSVDHELSGNVIDLCPVGALNSRPFKMHGRGWEMTQTETVSPHDCVGSNLYGHVLRGEIKRVVPRVNESVNENWISDRDRFSYAGLGSSDRLEHPMVKEHNGWREVSWEAALETTVNTLRAAGGDAGVLASPSSTTEELYLLQKLARGLGIHNIDTRVRQADFRDDAFEPLFPSLGQSLEEIEQAAATLVIGSNVRKEVPLLAHRLRKAALKGSAVMFVNPRRYQLLFPVATYLNVASAEMVANLAAILKASGKAAPAHLKTLVAAQKPVPEHEQIASKLAADGRGKTILLGALALAHPAYADIRALAAALAEATGAKLGYISHGANSAGAALAGALPHRLPAGSKSDSAGLNAREMLAAPRKAYLLMGLEPELDCWDGAGALKALKAAQGVVAITPFVTDTLREYATVMLPACAFGETSGTFVNAEGRWQSFTGMAKPRGEARPAWKILRVLGNLSGLEGFDYVSSEQVRDELHALVEKLQPDNSYRGTREVSVTGSSKGLRRIAEMPIHAVDALVRRAQPLQDTRDSRDARQVALSPEDAKRLGVADANRVAVKYNGTRVILPVKVDDGVHGGEIWLAAGIPATAGFAPSHAEIELEKA
ncbi:MAG TPA: NADH-quinone oxidoreductase subunit NuoG [Gammaproteobacteria bacterium]|nr:NADH-quinone oxidoreductase subunit NuoG [Gammaproteobacteria bacterium]